MQAMLVDSIHPGDWLYEIKFDGYRALQKIRAENRPFSNLLATGRNQWEQGLTAAETKRCCWVKPECLPDQIHGMEPEWIMKIVRDMSIIETSKTGPASDPTERVFERPRFRPDQFSLWKFIRCLFETT